MEKGIVLGSVAGLAETAGDPFRHLSDSTQKSWKIERWIHSVLVFSFVTTIAVIFTFCPIILN
jgi:hypothetical protein